MRRPWVFLVLSLSAAVPLFAGDPVPDVDVTVEQVLGKGFTVNFPAGGAFAEVRVRLPRGTAKDVTPGRLPSGWALSRDGRDLILKGPEVAPPVRLRMALGSPDRSREVGYEVLRGGAPLVLREGVAPRTVPPYEVRNSLHGIVYLPPDVTPGETITLRALEDAPLPPGGRFMLSGIVAEPIPEEDLAGNARSPDAGFSPSCQAEVSHVLIRGEIDSQRLLRGESTPMRLFVQGTADRVPVRIRNLTPGIITIEGGEEQVTESSGGQENVVTRQVRRTGRGSFNVEWSLASPPCPCGEASAGR